MIRLIESNFHGLKTEALAFLDEHGRLDPLPTLLFAKMCEGQALELLTKRKYGGIVEFFFHTLKLYNVKFKEVSNEEILGFIQGYYEKKLPFQHSSGKPISLGQMQTVLYVLEKLFEKGQEYGFCEVKRRQFSFKKHDGTFTDIDEAKKIESNYISPELFDELLKSVGGESDFVKERDQLALRLGYEVGLRSHELVRGNNFSITKLLKKQLTYRLGEVIEWYIVGKGGKGRFVQIKQGLAESIFDFLDKHKEKLRASGHLFCCAYNGEKLAQRHGNNVFKACADNLGHDELNDLSFHSLRHSYATNLATWCNMNKVNPRLISDRLGHSSAETTAIYVEVAHIKNNDYIKSEEMRMVRLEKRTRKTR